MARFQRPLVAKTTAYGHVTITAGGGLGPAGSSYKMILTSMRMSSNTKSQEIIEENYDAAGANASEGVARNIAGADVVNHVSLGYMRGSVELRGLVPFNEAIGLTQARFVDYANVSSGTGAVESATKIFEVEVRLAQASAATAHEFKFKMFFERFDVDWSVTNENVQVVFAGPLTGLVDSGAYSDSEECISFRDKVE